MRSWKSWLRKAIVESYPPQSIVRLTFSKSSDWSLVWRAGTPSYLAIDRIIRTHAFFSSARNVDLLKRSRIEGSKSCSSVRLQLSGFTSTSEHLRSRVCAPRVYRRSNRQTSKPIDARVPRGIPAHVAACRAYADSSGEETRLSEGRSAAKNLPRMVELRRMSGGGRASPALAQTSKSDSAGGPPEEGRVISCRLAARRRLPIAFGVTRVPASNSRTRWPVHESNYGPNWSLSLP
jgi:hypothetical protein